MRSFGARISKGYSSHIFLQIQTNFIASMLVMSHIAYYFLGVLPKKYGTLKNLLIEDHYYGAGNFKTLLLLQRSSNLTQTNEDTGDHSGIQGVTFLCNWPSFKKIATLRKFNMGVNGKILKIVIC